ncbi:MAG: glutamate 5-kinase [Oligoflexia bacterium]|nr:glutamate 5-kinase [Oligoflexia bacterium]
MNYREKINNAKRIVIKLGTSVLFDGNGEFSTERISSFARTVSELKKQGKEIFIVSSGSVGMGVKKLGLDKKPGSAVLKQACAAVGQSQIISVYQNIFNEFRISVAQILITEEDFSNRDRFLNLRDTLDLLIKHNIVPIINENDAISAKKSKTYQYSGVRVCFGDNDKLSALVMSAFDADILVMLSDVDGLYDSDPSVNEKARVISVVHDVDREIKALCFNSCGPGRGGMRTKLEAARIAAYSGGIAIIANGKDDAILEKVFSLQEVGTFFVPKEISQSKKRKMWIAYATTVSAQIVVNSGAKNALLSRKASLLPVGITGIRGYFKKGDVVGIMDEDYNEFARGIVNYSDIECSKVMGKHSSKIDGCLGYGSTDEVIHSDNIAILL